MFIILYASWTTFKLNLNENTSLVKLHFINIKSLKLNYCKNCTDSGLSCYLLKIMLFWHHWQYLHSIRDKSTFSQMTLMKEPSYDEQNCFPIKNKGHMLLQRQSTEGGRSRWSLIRYHQFMMNFILKILFRGMLFILSRIQKRTIKRNQI